MSDQNLSLYQMAAGRPPTAEERRWEGVLTPAQMDRLRARGARLAYDPVQIGWVRLEDSETVAPGDAVAVEPPLSWHARGTGTLLTLRDWTADDVPVYRDMLDDEVLWRYMPEPWPGAVSLDMAADLIRIAIAAPHHSVQAVVLGQVPVGQVRLAFSGNDPQAPEAEISYWLRRSHWGRGLGCQIVQRATARGFAEHPHLGSIFATVHPENRASAKVLVYAGYAEVDRSANGWRVFRVTR